MSKEILKGIFEENIAPVREDITFEGWVDKIKDNEEYKVGLFENYVQPSMPDATFEDFNAETFGLGKVEAPLGGAQSAESVSPTESVSSEFEVGPPGVEPKGAPVAEAAALVGEVEPTMMGQELDPYTIVEEDDRNFFERLFGEERYRRVTERAVETVPALTRLFGKAAAKGVQEEVSDLGRAMESDPEFVVKASQSGLFTTNNLATYLSQEAAGDKKGAEEINMFLEKGAEGKTTQFQRFKTLYAPIEKERNEAIQKELLSNRDYVALRGKIDAEFNRQRVGVDEKYDFKALMGEEFKVGEKELLDKYESATLALPMQLETKANELKFEYQAKVNGGQISVDEANAGLRRDLDAYGAELQKQSDKALEEYNSGVTALAEKLEKGVKDKPEFKAYMDELNDLRNGVVESFSDDYQKIQQSVFNNVAPKYNSKIETAITNSMKGETPLLDKSGVKGDIAKIVNNRGWDYLAFDQKKAALDTMFGTALSKLKRSGVEINDGVVANLRAEFDDAFMDRAYFTKKGTPSLFMVKTRAIEEAERLDEMLKEREAKTGTKTYTSGIYGSEFGVGGKGYDDTDVQELRLAREKLQEIIDMPETMSDSEWSNFWNGLTSGQFIDYLPFVSGLKNLSGTLALYRAVGKDTESARYLKNAEALNSTYQNMYEVNNIASDWYKAGKGTAQSLPFMMEFAATAGVGSGVRLGTEKVVVKLLGKQAETVVGKSLKVMAGTLISSLAQTTLNPQRYVDETLKRMTPQMTMAFSPEGDDLVAMLDSSDVEGGFEAALKGFGVTASEYFSEGLGFAGARAMKAVGSKMLQNEFLKRAYVGWYMSKFNFDTPTAFKKIAEMGGWNGFLMEFGEELANIPLTNLITGDAKVMEGIIKDGELDTENLADVARTLLPISLAGGAVSLSSLAISKIAPEGVTITYRDINNLPATETINKGVWDAVTEVMKSPAKVRDFIANELPKLKVEGKGRQIVTSMLERAAIEFDRGVAGVGTRQIAEATSPLEVTFEPIDDSEKAPKVEIIAKRRQKLNRDRTKLVPTGGFDYFAKVGDKEVKLSDAEYKAYKESGVLPESVSAVEATPEVEGEAVTPEVEAPEVSEEVVAEEVTPEVPQAPETAEGQTGEVISPEVAEALSTEDATRIALESLEVLPEGIESAEEGARIYHEAIGKEERTEAEDAVVMAVEDAVIGGAVVPEVAEAVEAAEAVTPEEVSTEGVTPEVSGVVEAAEGQPSAEGLTSKEKAEQYKKEAEEIAKEIRRKLKIRSGIKGNIGISPFSRAKRLAELEKDILYDVKDYIYKRVAQAIQLSKVYTFKDFVEDMKENSKRLFGVQIEVADSDKSIFHSARSRFEINDAFAQEILDLKDDFLFSIAAMSGRMNMNFQEFISSNSALVNGFVNRAESIYGLDDQAMMLVQEMYQDALRAAANRAESYTTLEDVKKFHETKEELLGLERDMERARINEEIKRRRNWLSRNFDKFQRAFITPVKNFNRAFGYRAGKFSDYRTSQERDVYSARKYRMGASTKAGNWYNAIHNKIYGGLSWFEKVELDKYLIYRRIVEVSEVRNQRAAEHKKLENELAAGVTPVRKQEIKEAMAELEKAGIGEVKSGSIMVDGKKEEYTVALAEAFVNDINARNDALAIKIRNRAEMYTEANNELLKMRLDSGEISQEAYDSMQKRDYVRRLFVDLSNTTLDEANYSPVSKEIKAIKEGSEDAILEMDTQALLQINAQITFDSVAKNNFIKKVVGWSEAKQQDYLDKALEKFKDARARTERYLRSSPRPLTQDEIDRFIKEQTLFIPLSNDAKVPSGFTAQKYFVDGVEKRVAVRNDIANIFQTPSGRGINENSLGIKLISALLLTPVIKASAVFVNPAFAIGNFALDVIHASMVTRDLYKSFTFNLGTILAKATGYTAENIYRKAVKYGASLFGRTARDSKFERLVKDYFEHGGGMSGLSNPSSRMYSDKLSSSALRRSFGDAMDGIIAVLDVINSLQSGSELITRVIVYEAALDKNIAAYREKNGVDPVGEDLALMKMSAAASSADLIDFREGAEATKAFDQTLLPFLNAMIQGAKAEIDFASKNPLLAAARLAEFGGMALGAALYNANSGDEDEKEGIVGYNGITDYIKSNYFVMMMPWTKKNERGEIVRPFISIKLPAALKATNILVSGMVADQGAENTIGQMASALEGGYVPEIGSVSPTAQIFMALNDNRDAFRKGAPVYRGRADVLLTERFNAGETKAIYRDLFGAMYDLINEDGENEGVLGFDEAGPAQWQAAFEKAISSNNPYYLGITSTYATISSLYGKDNKKEVDALMDEKFAALNAFRSRVYREPNSSVQQKNMKDRKQVDFLRDQIGSWQKKNDDAIEFAAKTIRDINKLEGNSKNVKIDLFFDREVFNYISDAQMIKGIKDQGIKDIPENLDDLNKVINKEQTRLSLRLLEEFKPNFVFKHPALKSYAQSEDSYVGLNAEMINKIAKEYDSSRNRRSYLIALKFVAGDDFKNIVQQIGAHERDLSVVNGITETTSATKYKRLYLRPDNRSSKPISSESAINNLILLKYLLTNE
jgi:hypothetical protein